MFLQHLKINSSLLSPFVLLPGDPGRVDIIVKKLRQFKIIGQNREYRIGTGNYEGTPVTVCSTGIGCSSTAIAVEELIDGGAKVLIRVGTCGGAWRKDVPAGSIIIPTASVRDEGTTREYIPEGFPAVADPAVINALVEAAQSMGADYFTGINRTHDAFYGSLNSTTKWGAYLDEPRWKGYDTPILSSEMETSALFVIASLRNVRAGAVLAVNADPEPLKGRVLDGGGRTIAAESGEELTARTVDLAVSIALEAISKLK